MSSGRNRIRELRGLRGLTLEDVAEALDVTARTVYRWEKHEFDVPRKHWQQLADLFRVQVAWMLGIESDGENGEQERRAS